ncbi:cilia- and flagella-associated protein 251-like [Drosophila sechellia]|uniref:cilia- and flagella-associated protein 251-like n=1 Tax=Drosophila sechellia TaxID=7238 RepID=UPI0013DE39AD|nr:cilia- and flagella-associated protein 251-like [Drosophila sechellia]
MIIKESEEEGQKEKEEPGYCKKAKDSEEAKDKEKPEMKTIQASKRAEILGDTKGKEDPNPSQDVEDVKDTEEPEKKKEIEQTGELEEPVVIEGEETEDPKKKVQKEFDARTQAQEMKYTTIDDLLVEAVRKVVGIEENKAAEDEPEGDKEPTTNGVCELSTDGNLKHLESKESTAVEEETKETESDDEVIFFEPLEKTENVGTTANPTNENSVKPQAKDDEESEEEGQKEKEEPGYCKKAKDSEEAKDKEKPEMKTIQASKRAEILGDTKGKEDPNPSQDVEDVKDTEEPEKKKEIEQTGELEEPVVIEGEETEDPKKKVQKEFDARTQAQEMKYTTIDDLLVEAVRKVVGIEENKAAEDEPEGDKEPTTNGVCELSTDGNLKHLESKESTAVEEETKETESDDEVIFFEPLEKTENVGTTANPTNENSVKPQAKDDEVVLVSEDEDETPQNKIPEKEVQTTQKETALKELSNDSTTESGEAKDLQIDNSDNACDQFEKLKTHDVG